MEMMRIKAVKDLKERLVHKFVKQNISRILETSEKLFVNEYGYEIRSNDELDSNIGFIFKIERPPVTRKRHSYYKHSMGFYQTHGYLFFGNQAAGLIFEKRKKDVLAKVEKEYAKLV